MPDYKFYTKRQLEEALRLIGEAAYVEMAPLTIQAWCTREPVPFDQRQTGEARSLKVGDRWGDLFDCAWFHFTGAVPQEAAGDHVVLLLNVNGEMCVFDAAGVPVQGLTPVASGYDYSLGKPGKRVLEFADKALGGEPIDVWADAGYNDLFGNVSGDGTIQQAAVAICRDAVRDLYFDFEVLLDFLRVLDEESPRYHQILTGLTDVTHVLYGGIPETADEARAILKPLLDQAGGDPSLEISAVGHAHMDLAWLWPLRETVRKGARTFSTAVALADRYPDYIFGASQPQYFAWMKEHFPALYAKIKAKVAEGRLEPQGAMWVEADTNVSGGEALVRQVLHGKRFFKQEFGVDLDYLWLPDVFGYSASLPQILRKAGVTTFSTQKLSWSLINVFPHHSFHWEGIDGTKVLTHMLPEETYNSPAAPRSVRKIEQNYKDKGVSHHALLVFGIGDGGGGPGEEHLERLSRIKNLAGLSPVKQETAAAFFKKWRAEAARFPTWVGELYLERHEGTLTTEARNKWYNRKMELGLRGLEWRAIAANLLMGVAYPHERLTEIWREVLLYQFHDILPGSSIKRVYDESLERYAAMHAEVGALLAERETAIADSVDTSAMAAPVVVHNDLSWDRREWVRAGDRWIFAEVPAMGYAAVDAAAPAPAASDLAATTTRLENDRLTVTFGEDGTIVSLFDKGLGREILPEGAKANELVVFVDPGDAWDFPMDYAEQTPRTMALVSSEAWVDGPQAVVKQIYRLGYSELVQRITLTAGSARLDFVTDVRWRETRSMLRTRFPVDVHANAATYEIQFGHLQRPTHRNTTWDLARDEVAAHKWVDLSQRDFGVALLNDSKYGHKIKDNVIDLNLLRSAPYPGYNRLVNAEFPEGEPHEGFTDQCDHTFTYALYPHAGDAVTGGVVQAGYALNVPLRVTATSAHAGDAPLRRSLLSLDTTSVIVEAVKQAEDGEDVVVRLYEATGASVDARVSFGFPVSNVAEADLMENPLASFDVVDGTVALSFTPFEIKTLRLSPEH
ncbi:MAG: alpha-mannosidase [Anaerolineae bacterium]|nr:alpha-mannosidase [Anaerolineae bacterium]